MSAEIDVTELGIAGRQAPDPTELVAILAAIQTMMSANNAPVEPPRVPSWRFAGRTWGKHAALVRTRPHRPNSF